VLAVRRRKLGDEDESTLMSMHALGRLLKEPAPAPRRCSARSSRRSAARWATSTPTLSRPLTTLLVPALSHFLFLLAVPRLWLILHPSSSLLLFAPPTQTPCNTKGRAVLEPGQARRGRASVH
jgi:hypothetical protein